MLEHNINRYDNSPETTEQCYQAGTISAPINTSWYYPDGDWHCGTYPIQALVEKKMLSYWWNIHRNQDGYPYRVVETQKEYHSYNSTWASTVEALLNKYGITSNYRNQSKGQWKRVTTKKILSHCDSMVHQTAAGMSKGKDLAERKSTIKREAYIVDLPKKHAGLILLSRCDMLPFKMNTQYNGMVIIDVDCVAMWKKFWST